MRISIEWLLNGLCVLLVMVYGFLLGLIMSEGHKVAAYCLVFGCS